MDVWCQHEAEPNKNFHDRQQAAAADEMELSLRVKSSSSVRTNTKKKRASMSERKNGQKREEQAYINC